MNQQSEKNLQNKILKYLKKLKDEGHPIYYEKRQAGGFSYKKGVPDIYFTYYGFHFEVELKTERGKLSSTQLTWKNIFKDLGVAHFVINSFSDFVLIMKDILSLKEILKPISEELVKLSDVCYEKEVKK